MILRYAYARVTSVNTCLMKDITLLELVDLDRSPNNRIVSVYYPDRKEYLPCPHHIVQKVATLARENINETLEINNMKTQINEDYAPFKTNKLVNEIGDMELQDLINSMKLSTSLLKDMQERVENLEKSIALAGNNSKC